MNRKKKCFLADEIYPNALLFVQSVLKPTKEGVYFFVGKQEGCRKDVDSAFGELQTKLHIISRPGKMWKYQQMKKVMN